MGLAVTVSLGMLIATAIGFEDGLGTNHINNLRVQSQIDFGGQVRSSWPIAPLLTRSGTIRIPDHPGSVVWDKNFKTTAALQDIKLQTDSGSADIRVVRSPWNSAWTNYDTLLSLTVDSGGTASSAWSSNWMSNDYRVGILVTSYTGATNLWWSLCFSE